MAEHTDLTRAFNAAAAVPPSKTHAERKIEELQQLRRPPTLQPTLTPKGPGVKEVVTEATRRFNEALDRQITFWQEQIERQRAIKDRARTEFNRQVERRER
ncbi:MAG: hypothetical protein IT431_11720 [Phycisphaerales bacterium]|nr:hypothetical protein [Phycisphaerales bacterium]